MDTAATKSEQQLFIENDLKPAGQRVMDTITWTEEKNNGGGMQQWGADLTTPNKTYRLQRNLMYPMPGVAAGEYTYRIDIVVNMSAEAFEWQLNQLCRGEALVP